MTIQHLNILLYFVFWAVFALGTWTVFKFAAALVRILDDQLPGGCPRQLRFLTWLLTGAWSMAMFSEGLLMSGPYLKVGW